MERPTPLILFDIDRTLINTDVMKSLICAGLALELGISEEKAIESFKENYAEFQKNNFSPEKFLQFFAREYQHSLEKLKDVLFDPHHFQAALYPEVISVLTTLRNQGYTLGLYSEGDPGFQEHKMLANNLMEFFDTKHHHISRNKKDPAVVENLPEGTVIVDDTSAVIEFLEQHPHLIAVQIIRKNNQQPLGPYAISSLSELLPLLDSLGDA